MPQVRFQPHHRGRHVDYCKVLLGRKHVGFEAVWYKGSLIEEPDYVYYALDAYRTKKEARERSKIKRNEPVHMADEYWWTEDEVGDAFFPTFNNVDDLVAYVTKQNAP